ncbi:hypothetical protein BH09BAC2_BH09BAC2_13380 [soil metagenome]
MIFKKDNFLYGLLLGLFAPMVGILIYKFVKFKYFTFDEMMLAFRANPGLITVFISVSLLANAVLFTVFINGHRDNTAKGIFVMTVIYALVAMLFKYL